jgi:anti-anti-sigma regulatory factor
MSDHSGEAKISDEVASERVEQLLEALERLAAGDVATRVAEHGGERPVDRLATGLNRLAERLAETTAREQAVRHRLEQEVERRTTELVEEIWASREAEQLIVEQQAAIRQLSTPALPIWPGIVVMPLVGTIDAARGAQVVERLLGAIVAHEASVAIVDLTGVPFVDARVAHHLLDAMRAVRLLGGRVILTGASRANAQALATLGVDRRDVTATASLRTGLAKAIRMIETGAGYP